MEATIQAIYEAFQRLEEHEQQILLQVLLRERKVKVPSSRESIVAKYQQAVADGNIDPNYPSRFGSAASISGRSLTLEEMNEIIFEHNWEDELDEC